MSLDGNKSSLERIRKIVTAGLKNFRRLADDLAQAAARIANLGRGCGRRARGRSPRCIGAGVCSPCVSCLKGGPDNFRCRQNTRSCKLETPEPLKLVYCLLTLRNHPWRCAPVVVARLAR